MKWPDGQLYDGDYKEGRPHGYGVAIGADKERYGGAFAEGLRHGTGLLTRQGEDPVDAVYEEGELRSTLPRRPSRSGGRRRSAGSPSTAASSGPDAVSDGASPQPCR